MLQVLSLNSLQWNWSNRVRGYGRDRECRDTAFERKKSLEEEKERFQKAAYAVLGMLNKNCKLTRLVLLPFMFLVELGIQSVAIVFHSFEDTVSVKYIKAQTHQQSQNMYLNTGACISLPCHILYISNF